MSKYDATPTVQSFPQQSQRHLLYNRN